MSIFFTMPTNRSGVCAQICFAVLVSNVHAVYKAMLPCSNDFAVLLQ